MTRNGTLDPSASSEAIRSCHPIQVPLKKSPKQASDASVRPGRALMWAWVSVAAALPTVVWRAMVGLGFTLGTPASWRFHQRIPGTGTTYVLALSIIELAAALLTPLMFHRALQRLPTWLVTLPAVLGLIALGYVQTMSIVNWENVNPFAGQPVSAWLILCHACYLAALVWPAALLAAIIGNVRWRRHTRSSTR